MKVFKNWLMRLYLKLSGILLARYYRNIDNISISNFTKAMAGDLSQVSKNRYFSEEKARKVWAKLFNQHIKAHGLPVSYVQYIAKMAKALKYYDEACKGKKWQVVKAKVYEAEAKTLLAIEGEKIETSCARISKFMGYSVQSNKCSVVEFYNYVAIMA